jgi:prephenate dehydratase
LGNLVFTTVRTLGPEGSNLEAAAHEWFRRNGITGNVVLHPSVEDAIESADGKHEAIMACAAYPKFHDIVFGNLATLEIVDSFIMPTHNMVLAAQNDSAISTCASHRAPSSLLPEGVQWVESTSNSQAALDCLKGLADACITTDISARRHGMTVLHDFGPVPMAFTLHAAP